MKLKYYLRGLGIGVVVAALLMGFTKGGKKEAMTDEEIIARAQQLGMVESSVLSSDLGNDTEEVAQEENQANDNTVSDDGLVVATTEDTEEKETQEAEEKAAKEAEEKAAKEAEEKAAKEAEEKAKKEAEEKAAKEAEEKAKKEAEEKAKKEAEEKAKKEAEEKAAKEAASKNESGNYIVTVYGGDGSRAVANRLEEMGAIKNAAAFDDFLCKHGYDRKLTTGKHEIKAGSSEQEIAEALMKKPQ